MQKMTSWTEEQLVRAWIQRYATRPRILTGSSQDSEVENWAHVDGDTFWAFQVLDDLVARDPPAAWRLILQILELAGSDDEVLDNLAAGPLEDLLRRHGPKVISWVVSEADTNPAFRNLLTGVDPNAASELAWQRVERAIIKSS